MLLDSEYWKKLLDNMYILKGVVVTPLRELIRQMPGSFLLFVSKYVFIIIVNNQHMQAFRGYTVGSNLPCQENIKAALIIGTITTHLSFNGNTKPSIICCMA